MKPKSKRTPAHLVIREYLLGQIKELPPNARIPTEVALAKQFGVSRLTVHKTVMRLQQEGIVVRRGKGGTFVAREAHRIQVQGGRGRNGKLAIAYPNWFSYDFWLKVDVAERLALQHGMTPVPIKLNPDTPIREIVEMVRHAEAKGLLLIAPGGVVEKAEVRILEELGCPCVLLQPNAHVRSGHTVYSVSPDYRKIGQMQVELLAERGHDCMAYVREEPWSVAGELQLEGMREAAKKRGLPFSSIITPIEHTGAWGNTSEAGYGRTRVFMSRIKRPSSLIFDALAGAHAGIRALHELGVRVPDEVSVLVSAPDHPFSRYDWPRLGGVSVSPGALVERAVEILLQPQSAPRLWVEPVAELRESVDKVRSKKPEVRSQNP